MKVIFLSFCVRLIASPAFVPESSKLKTATNPGDGVASRAAQSSPLESFEAVMQAMDDELAKTKQRSKDASHSRPAHKGKGKEKAENDDVDIEASIEAELKAALHSDDGSDGDEGGESEDYGLIKNFLESFKSQQGQAGPVSALVGRLQQGWVLPRDDS